MATCRASISVVADDDDDNNCTRNTQVRVGVDTLCCHQLTLVVPQRRHWQFANQLAGPHLRRGIAVLHRGQSRACEMSTPEIDYPS